MLRPCSKRFSATTLLLLSATWVSACAPPSEAKAPRAETIVSENEGTEVASPVSDKNYGSALHSVLLTEPQSKERLARLKPVLTKAFLEASLFFEREETEEGLEQLSSALYLLRFRELSPDMLTKEALSAFETAATETSKQGEAGQSLAFYKILSLAGKRIQENSLQETKNHLAAIENWLKINQTDLGLRDSETKARELLLEALLVPDPKSAERAEKSIADWYEDALSVSAEFQSSRLSRQGGMPVFEERAYEASRALRDAPGLLILLHTRYGSAQGARSALSRANAEKTTSNALQSLLKQVERKPDSASWLQIANVFYQAETEDKSLSRVEVEGLKAARFTALCEAYRFDPSYLSSSLALAQDLKRMHFSEAIPYVLENALKESSNLNAMQDAMQLIASSIQSALVKGNTASANALYEIYHEKIYLPFLQRNSARLNLLDKKRMQIANDFLIEMVHAETKMQEGLLSEAEEVFNRIVSDTPSALADYKLGKIKYFQNQKKESRAHYEEVVKSALTKNPVDKALRLQSKLALADITLEEGDAPLAHKQYLALDEELEALKSSTQEPLVHELEAQLFLRYGDFTKAKESYLQMLSEASVEPRLFIDKATLASGMALLFKDASFTDSIFSQTRGAVFEKEPTQGVYTNICLYFAYKQEQRSVPQEIERLLAERSKGSLWTSKLASFSLGKISKTDLLGAAKSEGEKTEALFYSGLLNKPNENVNLQSGSLSKQEAFSEILKQRALEWMEYSLAKLMLQIEKDSFHSLHLKREELKAYAVKPEARTRSLARKKKKTP